MRASFARISSAFLATGMLALAGCAQIQSRLPQRGASKPPTPVATPAKPRPTPARPVAPPKPVVAPMPTGPFAVLDPAHLERDRTRVRQVLGRDADALPAGDVGYTLDVLQGRLRQMAGARATVSRRGQRLALDLSRAVAFAPARAQPGPGAGAMLAPLGRLLADYRQVLVTVRVGSADAASGNDRKLALARAFAVAQALADAGVAKQRIVVIGTTGTRSAAGPRVEVQLDPVVRVAAVRPPAR